MNFHEQIDAINAIEDPREHFTRADAFYEQTLFCTLQAWRNTTMDFFDRVSSLILAASEGAEA